MVPEDVETEVKFAKKPEPQLVHTRSAVDEAFVAKKVPAAHVAEIATHEDPSWY